MKLYDFKANDVKWQKKWEEDKIFETPKLPSGKKAYILDMFPYPSGEGLHVGHPKGYIATDIYSRFKRMNGYDVLHPMGWDAFGLPAEQFALKNKVHPRDAVERNVANFKSQLARIGLDYDWKREINTTDSGFYKWTQWIFTKLYEKGLAYESNEPINWCPSCKTGLANEDVNTNGTCERCDNKVEKKPIRQWVLKITEYADRMLDDLDTLKWPEGVKLAQKNWIGRSEGAEFTFFLQEKPEMEEIVFASNNKGKVTRIQKLINHAGLGIKVLTPSDIGIIDFDVIEDGATLEENVIKKAQALAKRTKKVVFADDSGFFIHGEKVDPVTVKRNALHGKDEKEFTVEEIGNLMLEYYKDIATRNGGRVDAEWRNSMCAIYPDGRQVLEESIRPVILTDIVHGVCDPYLPLRALYISKATNKYVLEQTEEEEMLEQKPITDCLKKLFIPNLTVFTTRADTLYGATFVAISAELASTWFDNGMIQGNEIKNYITTTLEKQKQEKDYSHIPEKTGIFTGIYAINPATGEKIPVWIANYVLGGVGTGAIMAVPAHDERDFDFAKKYNLPIKEVVRPYVVDHVNVPREDKKTKVRTNVHAIVYDKTNKKYLTIRNSIHKWDTIVIGGVEEGEDVVEAAKRELMEETGYTDVTFKRILGNPVQAGYFAPHKDENRVAISTAVYFELESDKRVPVEEGGENEGNEVIWVTEGEFVPGKMINSELSHWLLRLKSESDMAYTEGGIMVNSNEYNGKPNEEVRDFIIKGLNGKKVVKYKIEDWTFARQRYWGEPFPVVRDNSGKVYMVDESELPVLLPNVESYEPTGTGESPLAAISDWVNVKGYISDKSTFKSLPNLEKYSFNKNEPLDINIGPGNDAYQSTAPIVDRHNVACIIKHPTEDKYLISKWKQVTWNGFLTGGIEDGQTIEDTARQEVKEETGYQTIKRVDVKDFSSHGLFYHVVKKQNRFAHYKLVIVELGDLTQEQVSDEEQAICDFVWVAKEEVAGLLTRFDMKSLWQYYTEGNVTLQSPVTISHFTRETNTMPQWAGSSWYYLRFADPNNTEALIDPQIEKAWAPVDVYVGGDHATRHLIYARFWHKFLYDIGVVSTIEPFSRLEFLGFILAPDGRKMSKRWGNIINPDDVVAEYGADTLRVYEMFMAPFEQTAAWSTSSIKGADKFLDKVYRYVSEWIELFEEDKVNGEEFYDKEYMTDERSIIFNQTTKKVTEDIENFKFNTAVSSLMILLNSFYKLDENHQTGGSSSISKQLTKNELSTFLRLLAPFAPHITDELWSRLGHSTSIHKTVWPSYDVSKLEESEVLIAIQIDGKMRGTFTVAKGIDDESLLQILKNHEQYKKYVGQSEPKKVIIVKNKLVNIVI